MNQKMNYKIILDSCGEIPEKLKGNTQLTNVALMIHIGEETITDDDTFDQASFLQKVAAYPTSPKSSCPSPDSYMKLFEGDEDCIFIVTLSAELSGSYSCAELSVDLYREEHEDDEKKIYVFNSKSASCGETQIALKIMECVDAGMDYDELVAEVEQYIAEMRTYFVLETLEHLRKNGRLTGMKAFVASTLNIKPVMGSTDEGAIQQLVQARGINKALQKMLDLIQKNTPDAAMKRLAIAHCNCKERALFIQDEINKRMKVKDIIIMDTAGISSLYAGDGGIIVTI